MAVLATPAQAGLLGSLGTVVKTTTTNLSNTTTGLVGQILPPAPTQAVNVVPAGYDPLTPLEQLLGGTGGLGNVLSGLTCKPLTEVNELATLLGVNPLTSGLTSLACSASILDYKFVTRFKRADGSILERTHNATLAVPTLLNVDDDSTPDLIGTLSLTGANSIGLTADRYPGETATLPVSLEAILTDSSGGLLGRDHIAFGYDAQHDRAPGRFVLSTPLDTILAPSPNFRLTVSQSQRGEKIALLGAIFDGTPTLRLNPSEVRLAYDKSPDNATVNARVGDDIGVTLTTNRPGRVDVLGRIVDGAQEDRFDASLRDMPSSLGLTIDTAGALGVTYSASARVAKILGTVVRKTNGPTPAILQKAVIELDDVPTGLTVSQTDEGGSVTTTGGPIGRTKVGIANGEPEFLTGEPAYLNLDDDGTKESVAVELPGLERATFAIGTGFQVGAKLASTPLLARVTEPGRDIEARVNELPAEFDLGFDPEGGRLDYDGRGDGIDEITVRADSATPLFSRATKLRGTLTGIPAQLAATLETGDGAGGIVVDGSGPIGGVELVASNGPEELPAGTGQGAIFRDITGGDFLIAGRILDLRELRFATEPSTTLRAVTRGGPFSLDVETDDLQLDGSVQDLPADATFGLDQDAGKLTFTGADGDGNPKGIELLTLNATAAGGLFGQADRVQARIEDLPASLELTLSPDSERVGVESSNPIGLIELVAANRAPQGSDLPAGTGQGVKYVDQGGEFVVGARVAGLKKVIATLGDAIGLETETAGGPFTADIRTDDITALASIEDLPAKLAATLDLAAGKLTLDGRNADDEPQGIERLSVDARSANGLIGRATDLRALVQDIPGQLSLDLAQSGEGLAITANDPIGSIEVAAANRPVDFATDLPLGGEQGAKLIDLTGGEYVIGARVRQLKALTAAFGGEQLEIHTETEGGPFGVRYVNDDLNAHARIVDLPAKLDAVVNLAEGLVRVNGNGSTIDLIDLDVDGSAPLFGEATDIKARIQQIPSELELTLAQSGNGVDFSANEPIGSVEVAAADRDIPDLDAELPAGGEQGAKFTDTASEYTIAARVRQLKRIAATLGDAVSVTTEVEPSPFGIRYTTDDLTALARIQDLPAQLTATIDLANGKITTDGSAPIELLTFDAQGTQPVFGNATHIAARIDDIPQALSLDIAQAGNGARLASDEPIGEIRVVAADRPVDLGADVPANQGVTFVDNGTDFLLAARVRQLELLDAGLGDDIRVDAKTEGGPFDVRVDTADLDADAAIRDLPQDVHIALNAADGKLTYTGKDGDGNPKGIDSLTASVRGDAAFFDRARRFDLEILKLAPTVTVDLAQDGSGAAINTDQPIESISFSASDDPTRTLADAMAVIGDPQGAVFRDTPSEYLLAGRVLDLRELTFGLDGESVELTSKLRSTPFKVSIASGNLDATARIVSLPEQAKIDLDLGAGALTYEGRDADGNPKAIDAITFSGDAPASDPLFGAATKLRGNILQVPGDLAISFSSEGGAASLETENGAIGTIEFLATNRTGPETYPSPQGARFIDRTVSGNREFEVAARVLGLEKLVATLGGGAEGGPIVLDTKTAGGLFALDVATDDFSATGAIDQLPSTANLRFNLDAPEDEENVRFQGSAPISLITLDANSTTPVLGRADKLSVRLAGLPQDVGVKLSQTQGKASVASRDSGGNPVAIGQIEVAAWNDSKELPAGGAQGAIYRDVPSGPFRIGARVNQLKTLSVDFAEAVQLSTETAGGPFTAIVQTTDLSGNVQINDLPTKLDLGVNLDTGTVNYQGSATINSIVASLESATPLFGDAKAFKASFIGVPTQFNLVASPNVENRIELTSTTGVIDRIDLQAGPSLATLPAFPGAANDSGAYADLSGGKFELAARIFKLNTLSVDLEPIRVQAIMEQGRRFVVDAKIPSGASVIDADAVIENLPANVTVTVGDRPGGGTDIGYAANAGINRLYLKATGLEILEGANDVEAEILSLPTAFSIALPETGAVAILDTGAPGNNGTDPAIGEVRLRAGSAVSTFPGNSSLDAIKYVSTPSSFGIGARISGIRYLSANLEPIDLTLAQDTGLNAPIDVEADIQDPGGPLQTVRRSEAATPVISKPSSNTRVQVIQGDQTRLIYNGTGGSTLDGIRLKAINLGGLPELDLRLTSIPSALNVCFNSGDACIRPGDPGPGRPRGGGDNYQPVVSLDAVSNHTSGFVNLNGRVITEAGGQPITINNVRFRNLAFDLTQGNSQNFLGLTIPRVAAYIDTDNAPFSIDNITYDSIENFGIGNTSSNNAAAQNRFVHVRGFNGNPFTGFGVQQTLSGSLNCGGRAILRVSGINILDIPILGQLVDLCSSGAP